MRSERGAGHGLRTESGPRLSGCPPCPAVRAPSAPGGPRYPRPDARPSRRIPGAQPRSSRHAHVGRAVPCRAAAMSGVSGPRPEPAALLRPAERRARAARSERGHRHRERAAGRAGPSRGDGAPASAALTPQGLAAAPAILRRGENPGPPPAPPADSSRRPAPHGLGGPGGAPAAGPHRRRPPGGLRYLPARAVGGSTPRAAPRPFPPSCPGLKLTRRDVRASPRDLYRPAAARGARARWVLAPPAARRGRGGARATAALPAASGERRMRGLRLTGPEGWQDRLAVGRAERVPPLRGPRCHSAPSSAPAAVQTGCRKALGLRGCLLVEVT